MCHLCIHSARKGGQVHSTGLKTDYGALDQELKNLLLKVNKFCTFAYILKKYIIYTY